MEKFMNLFTYTKKLAEKIKYYDNLTKNLKLNFSLNNPFKPNTEMLVIWVENSYDRDS